MRSLHERGGVVQLPRQAIGKKGKREIGSCLCEASGRFFTNLLLQPPPASASHPRTSRALIQYAILHHRRPHCLCCRRRGRPVVCVSFPPSKFPLFCCFPRPSASSRPRRSSDLLAVKDVYRREVCMLPIMRRQPLIRDGDRFEMEIATFGGMLPPMSALYTALVGLA